MLLPDDLVIMRHGQGENNQSQKLSREGRRGIIDQVYEGRDTSHFRLTEAGQVQAQLAGRWLKTEFGCFHEYLVSPYIRAIETAVRLGLPDVGWQQEPLLCERYSGAFGRRKEMAAPPTLEMVEMRKIAPFFWQPEGGESLAQVSVRQELLLSKLIKKAGSSTLMVCHEQVMWVYRLLLGDLSLEQFNGLYNSDNSEGRVANCEIHHYTRKNPQNPRDVRVELSWLRIIRPIEAPVWITDWREIGTRRYTNESLREMFERYPAVLR